jgi:hypothetical protein
MEREKKRMKKEMKRMKKRRRKKDRVVKKMMIMKTTRGLTPSHPIQLLQTTQILIIDLTPMLSRSGDLHPNNCHQANTICLTPLTLNCRYPQQLLLPQSDRLAQPFSETDSQVTPFNFASWFPSTLATKLGVSSAVSLTLAFPLSPELGTSFSWFTIPSATFTSPSIYPTFQNTGRSTTYSAISSTSRTKNLQEVLDGLPRSSDGMAKGIASQRRIWDVVTAAWEYLARENLLMEVDNDEEEDDESEDEEEEDMVS